MLGISMSKYKPSVKRLSRLAHPDKIWAVPNYGVFFVDAKEGLCSGLIMASRPKRAFGDTQPQYGAPKEGLCTPKSSLRAQNPVLCSQVELK